MKKSKFEKLVNEMIDCQKKFMDCCNEIVQSGIVKDNYTTRDFGYWYESANSTVTTLEDLKNKTSTRDLKIENVFGLPVVIELEEDEEKED